MECKRGFLGGWLNVLRAEPRVPPGRWMEEVCTR